MRDGANIPTARPALVATAAALLALTACSAPQSYPVTETRYCAEKSGIRAAKSMGCKNDEIGGLANTRGPNTSIEYPH